MSDLVFDMDDYKNEDGTTDWQALFGVSDEDMIRAEKRLQEQEPVKIPVQEKTGNETITFGEYGEALHGIRSMQVIKHELDPRWYRVDYVIESLSNIGGTLEVLEVKRFADEFGMSSWTFQPVEDWEFNYCEKTLRKTFAQMGGIGRY